MGDAVFSCGLNNYGQLGLGLKSDKESDTDNRTWLTRVSSLEGKGIVSVKGLGSHSASIAAIIGSLVAPTPGGVHHSLTLSSRGKLFAFGRSDSSQLGVASSKSSAGEFSSVPGIYTSFIRYLQARVIVVSNLIYGSEPCSPRRDYSESHSLRRKPQYDIVSLTRSKYL